MGTGFHEITLHSQKLRGQKDIVRLDFPKSERLKRFFLYQQLAQCEWGLPVKAFTGRTVDVPDHLVYIRLREVVKGTSLGQDFTDVFMVFLTSRFLPGSAGVTIVNTRALRKLNAHFKSIGSGKFSAPVCKDNRKDGTENRRG